MEPTEYLEGLKNGEESAFQRLVEDYQDRVYNTCIGFLKNPEDADDVAQEVFIEVFQSISGFREESGLGTWIYRIAVTKSLELIRKRKQKKRWAYFQSLLGVSVDTGNIAADKFYHPGLQLENKERGSILMEEIDSLPENQRIAFTLHKIEGLSYQEISAIMDTSLSSVESLMFRARKNLQNKLRAYYEENKE